ncbi:hypothetical protein [Falsirhodobacter halotolerans]|uniref:hypothetical protein n=1 Tax=Falsirhodobacter halotolerans TaxID=1146892 RepID=UPI001FD01BF1|nr:hypothetical protein [Falsirhodobacter halotolerans]MCJ8139408.1 hypothetical protein [Falsirhodobacter halotolerans]
MPTPKPARNATLWNQGWMAAGAALLILAWPFSLFLPVRISWENGVLENTQVVVLLVASIQACRTASSDVGRRTYIWSGAAILLIILTLRELSWGAVFQEPISVTTHGPTFSSSRLWYRPLVAPIIGAAAFGALLLILFGRPIAFLKECAANACLPLMEFLGFAIAMLLSTAAESHMGMSLDVWPGDLQVVEETVETAAYMFIAAGLAKTSYLATRTNKTR